MTAPSREQQAYRYERKFLPGWNHRDSVLVRLKTHPGLFREVYPPRFVNNVYFDSPGLANYFTHVNGAARRQKVRLRWYGAREGQESPSALEVKGREGVVGYKQTCRLGDLDVGGQLEAGTVLEMVRGLVPSHLRARLSALLPVLFNRYHRRYFVSADRRFRVTLDEQLAFRCIDRTNRWVRREVREEHFSVLELKYAVRDDAAAQRISGAFPYRLDRMSKYVHGMQRVHGHGGSLRR